MLYVSVFHARNTLFQKQRRRQEEYRAKASLLLQYLTTCQRTYTISAHTNRRAPTEALQILEHLPLLSCHSHRTVKTLPLITPHITRYPFLKFYAQESKRHTEVLLATTTYILLFA